MPDAQVLAELSARTHVSGLREIGRGAAATVYLGRQPQFDRDVAVKILNAPLADEKSLRRFARERQALGRVGQHPNIVSVHSSGTTPSGYAFLVMDYCSGGSLAARLPGQPLRPSEVTDIGVKLSSALAWAHAAGMLHRDIKPANVLLSSLGQPVLADFGIAAVEIGEMSVTLHESLTPIHAAPEVLLHGGGDPRSDVWSLGSTLYTLVAGRPPFAAGQPESLLAVLSRVTQMSLPPLQVPGSDPLFAVLSRALEKDPGQRIQSATEFGAALQQAQREAGEPVTTFLSGTTAAPPPPTAAPPSAPPAPAPGRSRRGILAGLAGGLGVLIVIAVVLTLTVGGGGSRPVAAPAIRPTASPGPATPTAAPTSPAGPAPVSPSATLSPSVSEPSGPALQAQPITRASPFGTGPLPFVPAITANAFDLSKEAVAAGKGGALPRHVYTRELVAGQGTALSATDSKGFLIRETEYDFRTGRQSPILNWDAAGAELDVPTHARVDYLSLDTGSLDPGSGMVGMKPGGRREIVVPFGPDSAQTFVVDYLGPARS